MSRRVAKILQRKPAIASAGGACSPETNLSAGSLRNTRKSDTEHAAGVIQAAFLGMVQRRHFRQEKAANQAQTKQKGYPSRGGSSVVANARLEAEASGLMGSYGGVERRSVLGVMGAMSGGQHAASGLGLQPQSAHVRRPARLAPLPGVGGQPHSLPPLGSGPPQAQRGLPHGNPCDLFGRGMPGGGVIMQALPKGFRSMD